MFTMKIDTTNVLMRELATMLREVADRLDDRTGANYCPNYDGNVHDKDGKKVGTFRYAG